MKKQKAYVLYVYETKKGGCNAHSKSSQSTMSVSYAGTVLLIDISASMALGRFRTMLPELECIIRETDCNSGLGVFCFNSMIQWSSGGIANATKARKDMAIKTLKEVVCHGKTALFKSAQTVLEHVQAHQNSKNRGRKYRYLLVTDGADNMSSAQERKECQSAMALARGHLDVFILGMGEADAEALSEELGSSKALAMNIGESVENISNALQSVRENSKHGKALPFTSLQRTSSAPPFAPVSLPVPPPPTLRRCVTGRLSPK